MKRATHFSSLGTVSTGNDHRLDNVTRESEKGFQVCAVENFKDTLFYSICRKCKDPGEVADNSGRSRRKRRWKESDDRAKQWCWRVLQLLSAMKSGLRDVFLEADARRRRVQDLKDAVEAHHPQNLMREIRRCRGFSTNQIVKIEFADGDVPKVDTAATWASSRRSSTLGQTSSMHEELKEIKLKIAIVDDATKPSRPS
ncbi:hypothetical protein PF011_g2510 [Phytophthora fragariae]|uniref:Uncharacterized protein n=2 Tax=Phytophthora fragariae TaxID=53985 RepID=A0A6A3M3S4_9STRA|nr:hypothetical protein PF003_g7210 [Phytophthora fragariae]KAE9026529.1 hypothetical protein PF011_g2510 [Phytophthora fragariae]